MQKTFLMAYGAIFQEYHKMTSIGSSKRPSRKYFYLLWIFTSFVLVLAYQGNLKSSLIKKYVKRLSLCYYITMSVHINFRRYMKPTNSIQEMLKKDLEIHISTSLYGLLRLSTNVQDQAIALKASEKNSVHPEYGKIFIFKVKLS